MRDGESDEQFALRVRDFAENIDRLLPKMNTAALEEAMYAANAEGLLLGIRGRITQANEIRARRRRRFQQRINP